MVGPFPKYKSLGESSRDMYLIFFNSKNSASLPLLFRVRDRTELCFESMCLGYIQWIAHKHNSSLYERLGNTVCSSIFLLVEEIGKSLFRTTRKFSSLGSPNLDGYVSNSNSLCMCLNPSLSKKAFHQTIPRCCIFRQTPRA